MHQETYDGNFATKMVLDLAFLDGFWGLLLDYLEQMLDTHGGSWYATADLWRPAAFTGIEGLILYEGGFTMPTKTRGVKPCQHTDHNTRCDLLQVVVHMKVSSM